MRRVLNLPFVICYAISLHVLYGAVLVLAHIPQSVGLLGGFDWLLDLFGEDAAGGVLLLVAAIAALGLVLETRLSRPQLFFTLVPQYAVLLYALVTGTEKMLVGFEIYSETQQAMIEVPQATVIAAIGPICLAAFWHTWAFIAMMARTDAVSQKQLQDELRKERTLRLQAEDKLRFR